jgi:hypothetical protein
MKRMVSTLLVLALTMCMTLVSSPSVSAAVTNQEAYYISVLKPKNMPKASESYPAKLLVKSTIRGMPANLTFNGTCGVNADISDEVLIGLMKDALSLTGGKYKTLQAVCDDVVAVRELIDKLKFGDKDIQEILSNWAKMLGVDGGWVKDVLQGKFPEIGAADVINSILDVKDGEMPMNPLPSKPGVGTIVGGVFITYEQYQKDIEKWDNIIKLSQTKARLGGWHSALNQKIQDYMKDNGQWSIKINTQDLSDMSYNEMPNAATLIWTAEIDLKKSDGGFESIKGNYTGVFKLSADADFSNYDSHFVDFKLDELNKMGGGNFRKVGNEGPVSELMLAYEISNCKLNISLPVGTNRKFIEEKLPSEALTQTDFTIKSDRMVSYQWGMGEIVQNFYYHYIEDNGVWVLNTQNSTDSGNDPWPPDTRGNITMTLVIDMLGK